MGHFRPGRDGDHPMRLRCLLACAALLTAATPAWARGFRIRRVFGGGSGSGEGGDGFLEALGWICGGLVVIGLIVVIVRVIAEVSQSSGKPRKRKARRGPRSPQPEVTVEV